MQVSVLFVEPANLTESVTVRPVIRGVEGAVCHGDPVQEAERTLGRVE